MENVMNQRTTSISQIRTVAIPVTDQERSVRFYTETLGFEKSIDAPFGPGQRWIELTPPGGGTTLAIPPLGEAQPGIDTGIRLETGDAEADHALLQAAGADVDPEILRYPGVPPMFTFRDPDGNRLYVVERM
jgi:catechol 2,3-dioxygenase-like lactoylglutathione lyase family enzyme